MRPTTKPAPNETEKPLLRGRFHQAAAFVASGACATLVAGQVFGHAGARTVTALSVYSTALIGLFTVSALYHRVHWRPDLRAWMRRLDHAAIFLLIAGTGTPICLLALAEQAGLRLLTISWIGAGAGVLQSIFWVGAPKWLAAVFYVALGWLVVPYGPEILQGLGPGSLALLVAGGLAYTAGAVVYALKRPNPRPAVFGYHEIFHLLVVLGALLHFVVILQLVTAPFAGKPYAP